MGKKPQIIVIDVNGQTVTRAEFNAMQKEVARLKEENKILKLAAVSLGEHRKQRVRPIFLIPPDFGCGQIF
ncbi:hypothetical protein DLJ48_05300 [Oenococcus sicerae]|uniref:Uncharacterized protein n=1 Tax=Oenococcus sicerae TaxID=2203724 RepID=A0ABX5QMJ8_9LACO|nr:hypothetical protein [Oenococcus sicerae]QAS69982.1 hypothetical protein DLJ48_05300 [Oenococcus sicerae]